MRVLIIISCLVTGYVIGDYRGSQAREALQQTIVKGQAVERELQQANAELKGELAVVEEGYRQDMDKLRGEYTRASAEWQRTRQGLDGALKLQKAKLAELNGGLDELIARLGGAEGAEKVLLEQKVAILRSDIERLLREVNGNSCLQTRVPTSVVETLNGTSSRGDNR